MFEKYLFLISAPIIFFGIVCASNEYPVPEPITIPTDIRDKISDKDGLRNQITQQIMKKCERNGGSEAISVAQSGFAEFSKCLQQFGKVSETFSKYCKTKSGVEQCFYDMLDAAKICFSDDEVKNFGSVKNVTKQLIEYLCYNDGDRITMLIAEGSQYCFMEHESEIGECFGTEGQNIFTADEITYLTDPISFNKTSCEKTSALQHCMYDALGKCKETTIANEVESLFELIRDSTPCHNITGKSNAPTIIHLTSATILLAVATSIMFFIYF